MLKKMFKTILVLSLCIGVVIPTNAAVSVSDGSAFVTKAEFAADLNNLSNRMAQLENSLDAKIDSLVSSYLTRNGIWNGAKQDLNENTWTIKDSVALPGRSSGYSYDAVLSDYSYRVVQSLSKTGLCVVVMSQHSKYKDRIFGLTQKTGNFARVYDSSFALFGYFTCDSNYSNASAKVSYAVGSGYGKGYSDGKRDTDGNSQSFGVFTQTTEVVNTYYFFVQKGDFIDTYLYCAYYVPTGTAFSYAGQEITFNLKSIEVY